MAPKTSSQYWVIYHNEDHDGVLSGYLLSNFYSTKNLIGTEYDFEPCKNLPSGVDVVVGDLAINEKVIEILKDKARRLIWWDHHRTSLKRAHLIPDNWELHIAAKGESAAKFIWRYHISESGIPTGLLLLSDYDVGNWDDERCIYYEYWARSIRPEDWNVNLDWIDEIIHARDLGARLEAGKKIVDEVRQKDLNRARNSGKVIKIDGIRTVVLDYRPESLSTKPIQDHFDADLLVCPDYQNKGVSIFSRSGLAADYAMKLGGGGHPNAGGAMLPLNEAIEKLGGEL